MINGLYAITDNHLTPDDCIIDKVHDAIRGGAKIIQYRDKQSPPAQRATIATQLQSLCAANNALLIINDDVKLAATIGASGVHLGKDDGDISAARNTLGATAIIGSSCYNSISLAQNAVSKGANYVAFGAMYSSSTKPNAPTCDLSILATAAQSLQVPIVAIGGITPSNAQPIVDAGASAIAVVGSLFDSNDVIARAQEFTACFQ